MRRLALPTARAGRALIGFWAVLLLGTLIAVATLQWLGPPRRSEPRTKAAATERGAAAPALPAASAVPPVRTAIAPPDPALLEPAPGLAGATLPRIAADGRQARIVYAAPAPAVAPGTRRIAILLDGIGLSQADSLDAIAQLPSPVSLAVSPYSVEPQELLRAARARGHELLLSLPMQPADALDDEGARALNDAISPEQNQQRLNWSLSRIRGYAGVTNAFVGMDGGRFRQSAQFVRIADLLARRGLFYLDATPGAAIPTGIASLQADLRLDGPFGSTGIDSQLAQLQQIAQHNGSAVAVAGPVFPVMVQKLADWARTLPQHGFILVPVSSLIRPARRPNVSKDSHAAD